MSSMGTNLARLAVAFMTMSCTHDGALALFGDAVRDSDKDGWYDANRNQLVRLFVERIDNHTGSASNAFPGIAIDDQIVLSASHATNPSAIVSSRVIGAWELPETIVAFSARLRIATGDISSSTPRDFTFHNRDGAFTVDHNGYVVHFRSTRTFFADPSPNDARGDKDADGLTDTEEASICSPNRPGCSPLEKDIFLAVGFTHSDWRLTQKSQDLLTTVFAKRAITLNLYTTRDPVREINPGLIRINGQVPLRDHKIALSEAENARRQVLPQTVSPFFHFLVLAQELDTGQFGLGAVSTPANTFVCRSHLPVLGPDVYEYQAKDVMHELGHNLGLCHPTESDDTCPTGSIPLAERNGALSAMGTPAESAGPVEVMVEALSRPVNYTQGQWQRLDLRRVKP